MDQKTMGETAGMERRDFLMGAGFGTLGLVSLGMLGGCAPSATTQDADATAPEAEKPAPAPAPEPVDTTPASNVASGGMHLTIEQINAIRKELVDSKTEDYVCEDGTVIPNVFVKLRTLIDTYGLGLGSEVHDHAWDEILINFTEEDAQAYLEMPRSVWFTATDFSAESGRNEDECLEICEHLSEKGLLMRARRAGVPRFHQLAEAHGIWEYNLFHYDLEYTTAHQTSWGADIIQNLYNSETPFYYAIPVDKEVVADEEILPYDDYEKIIRRNTVLSVSPCQCRLRRQVMGDFTGDEECDHPLETCIATGEEAEFYIENGIGRQITQDEALEILHTSVERGMVIQSAYTKDTEVICSCHGDCCDILASYVALGSEGCAQMNQFPNVSHYTLVHVEDTCTKCGMCEQHCPLFAITMDEETGFPVVGAQCVRCGQCGLVCPTASRTLHQKDAAEIPELPATMLDDYNLKSAYRLSHDYVK